MDLDYYKKIFNNKKFVDLIKKSERENIQTLLKIQQDRELAQEGANSNEIKKSYMNMVKNRCRESDKNYDDLKDIIKTSADTKITSQKEVLDNYEDIIKENTIREANINADKIEILSKALKDGLTKEKKYCQECGHTIDIDAKYCSNCGHKQ